MNPHGDYVVVRVRDEMPDGIEVPSALPGMVPVDFACGEILSVGPGFATEGGRVPLVAVVGELAIFSSLTGFRMIVDGEERRVLRENEIISTHSASAST